jgi:hypothetical protein
MTAYRVKDSCPGGNVQHSNIVWVYMRAARYPGNLSETHNGLTYHLTLTGGNSGNNVWYFGDGDSTSGGAASLFHTYAQPGTYNIMVVSRELCNPDTARLTITVLPTGITATADDKNLQVYPNPAGSVLHIQSAIPVTGLTLMDATGRIVLQQSPGQGAATMRTAGLPSGYYLLRVVHAKGSWYRQVSIRH